MSTEFEDYRMGHLLRAAEVWKQLLELGATVESKLDFDFQFSAKRKDAVDALKSELSNYPLTVNREGVIKKSYVISGNSGPITWSEEQLLKWVDYLVLVGRNAGCEFEGCGASALQ